MENQEKKQVSTENNDVDLGTILHLIVRGFKSIGRMIVALFNSVGNLIMHILLYLKRRLWWILGALVVGYAWGSYQNSQTGVKYNSRMTARYNFGSTRALYSTTEYLNNLLGEARHAEIGKLLSITPAEATSLLSFEAEPVSNEKEVSDLYREYFFAYNRGVIRMDTVWMKAIPYKDFRNGLTRFDYPTQTVTVVGTRPDLFARIQEGFINVVVSNGDLQRKMEMWRKMHQEEAGIILSSLHGLDTLRGAFDELLRKGGEERSPSVKMSVMQQDKPVVQTAPEIDLFNKVLEFRDELKLVRENEINNHDIVQVSAGFSQIGRKSNILKQQTSTSAMQALTLLFVIFITIEVFRALNRYEKKHKPKPQAE